MTNRYRTAHGKMLDIDKLRLVNEKTIAVGNMKVNARGDQLGQGGEIIATRNQVMNQQYKIHGTGTVISDNMPKPQVQNVAPDGESFDPPDFEETVKPVEPALRGSLADSIAKQAVVEQQPLNPDMHSPKPTGPQRI
jgi:hypothetical protein